MVYIPQAQVDRAIEQIQLRRRLSNVDFSQYVLDDGNVVSTQERVVKDVRNALPYFHPRHSSYLRIFTHSVQVQAPAMMIPTDAQFFSRQDPTKPDVAFLKNHFYREGRLSEDQALWIIEKATALLHAEPNVLQVDAPITGQYTEYRMSIVQ